MPTNEWTGGANDGNWQTAGNWSLGAAPVSNDDVIVAYGSQNITSGLSNAAVDLNSLTITFAGSIGTASTPLTIAVSGTSGATLRYAGSGSYCKITAGTNGIDRAIIAPKGNGTFYASGGTYAILEAGKNGIIEADAVITTLYSAGAGCRINYSATAVSTAILAKGNHTFNRSCATMTIGPGAIVTNNLAAAISASVTIEPGGKLVHNSTGTIASVVGKTDGVAVAGSLPFTVTNRTLWAGTKIF